MKQIPVGGDSRVTGGGGILARVAGSRTKTQEEDTHEARGRRLMHKKCYSCMGAHDNHEPRGADCGRSVGARVKSKRNRNVTF